MYFGQACILTINVLYPLPVWTMGGRHGKATMGVRGVIVVERLEGLHFKVGNARRRWFHM